MKRGTYFICFNNHGNITAEIREGYIDGDVGICKTEKRWIASHIPTGLKLAEAPARQALLEQVKNRISAPGFDDLVSAHKNTKMFKQFEKEIKNYVSE